MYSRCVCTILLLAAIPVMLRASAGVTVRGITHDPEHRPIAGAEVTIHSELSGLSAAARSNANGEFEFTNLAPGDYTITTIAPGFQRSTQSIRVDPANNPVLHMWMRLAVMKQSVKVSGAPAALSTQTSTTQTAVSASEIAETPGASRSGSLAMITDFVPGATVVHDMLHIRGGHQESWFLDGIPVVNTNIASNVGPVIDPKNVESLQVQTGGYSSEYGDRTYGFFNAVTPSGFSRNNELDLITSYGSFNQTDDLLSLGSHTERFAYYASVDGNRSDLGLSTPSPAVLHDQTSGLGGFGSVLYNPNPSNQLRFITSVRGEHYQIPNTAEQQANGIRDLDIEHDAMFGITWAHTSPGGTMLTVSPFYHFNRANYVGGSGDRPFILNDNRRSTYGGALATAARTWGKHNASAGFEAWSQSDDTFFGLKAAPAAEILAQRFSPSGNAEALFGEDQYRLSSWLTINAGVRLSHYGGLISENAASPRIGAAIQFPRLKWVLHGYYAQYYQPPPLDTVSGPLLSFAGREGYGFVPLRGERDVQHDVGLLIPLRRWQIEADHFRTSAHNFLDHDEIGNSDIFFPLTDLAALIQGTEVTLRSPDFFGRGRVNVVYSNQTATGLGPVTGGLLSDVSFGRFYLDHDQRNTVSAVANVQLPLRSWAAFSYGFGSGFLDGDGPRHLPSHSVVNLAVGKSLGERFSVSVNALNLAGARFMMDNSNTFGGSHYVNPREIYVQFRWRFAY